MKKSFKWLLLLTLSLFFLVACGTSSVTSQSTNAWDTLIYWFGSMIQSLSINGNIGLGIILFTLIIRTVLLPLFQMQMSSSRKMQELQPQLKALQEEYAGLDSTSRMELDSRVRQLYRENGVNLYASFLPLLIQMPILLGLYQALTRIPALKVGHFLWLNLGQADPYYVLPILAGVLTFTSMWLSNKATTEKTAIMSVMTYGMSVMIFIFALTAASGVALYWVVSSAYQVAQSLLLNNPFRLIAEREAQRLAEKERQSKRRKAQKKAQRKK